MRKEPFVWTTLERTGNFVLGVVGAFQAVFFNRLPATPITVRRISESMIEDDERPVTVLAIDDDPLYLSVISKMLKQEGLSVLAATSAVKGLDMLRYAGDEIDVVLLDFKMPTLGGDLTLDHLRKINADVKVIATTGVEVHALPVNFREGVDDILTKPFSSTDLIGCIQSLLSRSVVATSSAA